MELKEFIKAAITDITEAVSELQESINNGAIINPTLPRRVNDKCIEINNKVRVIENLNFDVAVTASESTGVEGGAKAGISIFGAKIGAGPNAKMENVSRLTFSIPIVLPCAHINIPKEAIWNTSPR